MRTVLCFGDSNTYGTVPLSLGAPGRRYDTAIRWPGQLRALLGPGWHVVEEGLPGRTTVHPDPLARSERSGRAMIAAVLETHRPLDAVVLMLGTNDLKVRYGATASDIGLGVEYVGREILDRSFDRASGPDGAAPHLLVVAPPPLPPNGRFAQEEPHAAERSLAAVDAIRLAAERLGASFMEAGRHASFSDIDGVHLEKTGHAALAHAIVDALKVLG